HADHIALAVPLACSLALRIELFEFVISHIIVALHLSAQFREHIVIAIQLHIKPAELVMMAPQPLCKDSVILLFFLCCRLCSFRFLLSFRFLFRFCLRFLLCPGLCLCFHFCLRFCIGCCFYSGSRLC